MASFIAVVVGLSLVSAGLILAIAAEIYYLIWWKRPLTAREIDEANTSYAQELLDILSRRQQRASSLLSTAFEQSQSSTRPFMSVHESDPEMGLTRSLIKHRCSVESGDQESVESELMRLHNLAGPPRFLFTIAEETKEDLDSEDGRSRGDRSRKASRNRSLSDLIVTSETPPFMTPIASPRITSPVLTQALNFNPLFEAASFEEIEARLRQSPPPKFKFLRDAEEKLYRRMKELKAAAASPHQNPAVLTNTPSSTVEEDLTGSSLITLIAGGKKDREGLHHNNSASSKILPLASSPTRFRLEYLQA
uniref:Transmembrane protein n=1 Tax=Kalanchoe fedtschenkoi TaxID=63787 RepID=A0A7N0RAK2_KALFE